MVFRAHTKRCIGPWVVDRPESRFQFTERCAGRNVVHLHERTRDRYKIISFEMSLHSPEQEMGIVSVCLHHRGGASDAPAAEHPPRATGEGRIIHGIEGASASDVSLLMAGEEKARDGN